MRRTLSIALLTALVAAACSSDDGDDSGVSTEAPADEEADSGGAQGVDGSDADTEEAGDTDEAGEEASEESDGTEGDSGSEVGSDPEEDAADGSESAADYPEKPEVQVPDEIPTELQSELLIEGDGPPAEPGDIVLVDYVGVRTEDGVEFDASYDRGAPLAVTLGSGGVIVGWDQGLEGAREGDRIQLDIPSELAYGDQPRGEIIRADEALTFVVDVRSVIPLDSLEPPEDAGVPPSEDATEVETVDLVEGDGQTVELGDTVIMHFVLFRGDNLVALDSSWLTEPIQMPLETGTLDGLLEGIPGMNVGGRRAIVIPPESGFGPDGQPQVGLPGDTDLVVVVDVLAVY